MLSTKALKADPGISNRASGLSISTSLPSLNTATLSESMMVSSRCAMVRTVESANSSLMVRWMTG